MFLVGKVSKMSVSLKSYNLQWRCSPSRIFPNYISEILWPTNRIFPIENILKVIFEVLWLLLNIFDWGCFQSDIWRSVTQIYIPIRVSPDIANNMMFYISSMKIIIDSMKAAKVFIIFMLIEKYPYDCY